ncbi:MAG TPA: hypothetical protein VMZ04_04980 [Anaerolineae bacterium]|nr:hypothetical protein [Anaerolineae bacterium]
MIQIHRTGFMVMLMLCWFSGHSTADNSGLFRTGQVSLPEKGTLMVSSTSFYAPITANRILRKSYGVSDSRIFTGVTAVSLGITDHAALTGTLPFYADLFSQNNRSGHKTGPGDITIGFRFSPQPHQSRLMGFSIGSYVTIPEQMGYDQEPLGFRTFSSGELAYGVETTFGLRLKRLDGYVSAVLRQFPNARKSNEVYSGDTFYDSGFGYLGIGKPDAVGRAMVIFQNHMTLTAGMAVPLKSWISGIGEVSYTSFTEKPERDDIVRAAPGIRVGNADRIHFSAGVDFRISGSIPDYTYMLKLSIPSLRPRELIAPVRKRPLTEDMVRSRNALVAVTSFSKSDITYLYERELKNAFRKKLSTMGIMEVIPDGRVEQAFQRSELIPLPDSPERLGVRLGSTFTINTDISKYTVERASSLTIPFVIGFPETIFSLSAQASVTNLVTGKTHDLGLISARIARSRGVLLFPCGASSDIVYLSEPEQRLMEKNLIDTWVEQFNEIILNNLDVFGWEPKRTELGGDEDISG